MTFCLHPGVGLPYPSPSRNSAPEFSFAVALWLLITLKDRTAIQMLRFLERCFNLGRKHNHMHNPMNTWVPKMDPVTWQRQKFEKSRFQISKI